MDNLKHLFDIYTGPEVETNAQVIGMLNAGTPVCLSISGGKDSTAMVHAVMQFLETHKYQNRVMLWHADLGDNMEWNASIAQCRKLADYYGLPLKVVKANQGTMLDGWQQRWERSIKRYQQLEIRTLIKPWSGPGLARFCTSGWKTTPLGRGARIEFDKAPVLNVVGIRREESVGRAKTPTSKDGDQNKFPKGTVDWFPIAAWKLNDVWSCINSKSIDVHEAYLAGCSRVSCRFCVLANANDLQISARFDGHGASYRQVVDLECKSAFSFQAGKWLADVAPEKLVAVQKISLRWAKVRANDRRLLESELPDFSFTRCVPDRMLNDQEIMKLAEIRTAVFRLYPSIKPAYTNPTQIKQKLESLL